MPTAPPIPDIVCRVAEPHEHLAARLLLPGMALDGLLDRVFVATDTAARQIVGAAAVAPRPRDRVLGRCQFEINVLDSHDGRGVEAALARLVGGVALDAGAGLVLHDWTEAAAPPLPGLRTVQDRFEFVADAGPMTAALVRLFGRLKAHGRIPADARAIPLREADLDAVAALHLAHFPGNARQLAVALRGGPPHFYNVDLSVVTLLGDQVTGYIVGPYLTDQRLFDIHWKAVAPPFRNGWTNLMLMHELAMRTNPVGVQHAKFRALDHNDDTRRVIRHLTGRVSRTEFRYGLDAAEVAGFVQ